MSHLGSPLHRFDWRRVRLRSDSARGEAICPQHPKGIVPSASELAHGATSDAASPKEGRERTATYIDGAWHDDVITGILGREFAQTRTWPPGTLVSRRVPVAGLALGRGSPLADQAISAIRPPMM